MEYTGDTNQTKLQRWVMASGWSDGRQDHAFALIGCRVGGGGGMRRALAAGSSSPCSDVAKEVDQDVERQNIRPAPIDAASGSNGAIIEIGDAFNL